MYRRNLGLDLGRVSGAAWREDGRFATSVEVLGRSHDVEAQNVALTRWVVGLMGRVDPECVVVETSVGPAARSRTLRTFANIVEGLCHERAIRYSEMRADKAVQVVFRELWLTPEQARTKALTDMDIEPGCSGDEIDAIILLAARERFDREVVERTVDARAYA